MKSLGYAMLVALLMMLISSCQNRSSVLLFGDSLIEYGDWDELLGQYNCSNGGIGGLRAQQLNRDELLTSYKQKDADHMVLMIGINDIINLVATTEIIVNITAILSQLDSKHLIAHAIIHQGHDTYYDEIEEVNSAIMEYCETQGIDWLDLNPVLLGEARLLSAEMTSDGTHLTERAYELWSNALRLKLGERTSP